MGQINASRTVLTGTDPWKAVMTIQNKSESDKKVQKKSEFKKTDQKHNKSVVAEIAEIDTRDRIIKIIDQKIEEINNHFSIIKRLNNEDVNSDQKLIISILENLKRKIINEI